MWQSAPQRRQRRRGNKGARRVSVFRRRRWRQEGSGSISCFGSCSEWYMSLPNVLIDWWVWDRWTHKELFAKGDATQYTKANADILHNNIHQMINSPSSCPSRHLAREIGLREDTQNGTEKSELTSQRQCFWQELFMTRVFCHDFYIIRHKFAFILLSQGPWRITDCAKTGVWALTCFYLDRMSSKIKTACSGSLVSPGWKDKERTHKAVRLNTSNCASIGCWSLQTLMWPF